MKLPQAPAVYSMLDQQLLRAAIEKALMFVVHFGRDIELAQGEKLILRSPNGTRYYLVVSDAGVLSASPV